MQALQAIDPEIAERIRVAGRSFLTRTPAERKQRFADRLHAAGVNLDALDSPRRRMHELAQQAVIGFEAAQAEESDISLVDAVLTILCDAHGGAHGSELSRSRDFNQILTIYHK